LQPVPITPQAVEKVSGHRRCLDGLFELPLTGAMVFGRIDHYPKTTKSRSDSLGRARRLPHEA
jgi:hypothetical protein